MLLLSRTVVHALELRSDSRSVLSDGLAQMVYRVTFSSAMFQGIIFKLAKYLKPGSHTTVYSEFK